MKKIVSPLFAFELEGFFEGVPMFFCPASDFGGVGHSSEESEKDEGEDSGKGRGDTLFGAGIGHIFEAGGEECEGIGSG